MRQLVIGLDAAEWNLITQWASDGALPTLARLLSDGASGPLSSVSAQFPDAAWPVACTSLNPAELKKYFYVDYDAASGRLRRVPEEVIDRQPFWDELIKAGQRVTVVDVPNFPSLRAAGAVELANWGVHPGTVPASASPASLLKTVIDRFGRHPVGDCGKVDNRPSSLRPFHRRLLEGVKRRGQLLRWMLVEHPADTAIAVFSEIHCAGHVLWRDADAMREVYRAVDRELAEIVDAAGSDAFLLLFSVHGMGPMYHASWNLPEILDLLGYAGRPARRAQATNGAKVATANRWRALKMIVPGRIQYAIKNRLPRQIQDQLLFRWYAGSHSRQNNRAFAVPNNDSVGSIRVSVRGRDRGGVVEPGGEYRRICEDLAAAFTELTDHPNGRRIVKSVSITAENFSGSYLDHLPDVTILWDNSFAWSSVYSPQFGQLILRSQDGRSGMHTDHGFAILTGRAKPAKSGLIDGSIYDIGPTVLARAGVAQPVEWRGRSLL